MLAWKAGLNPLIITCQQRLLLIFHPQLPVNTLLVLPHRRHRNLQCAGNLSIRTLASHHPQNSPLSLSQRLPCRGIGANKLLALCPHQSRHFKAIQQQTTHLRHCSHHQWRQRSTCCCLLQSSIDLYHAVMPIFETDRITRRREVRLYIRASRNNKRIWQ